MADLALVINLGSSSLKAALVDSTGATPWHSGRSIAADASLEDVLDSWLAPELEPHRYNVAFIGHRVVHGGERFTAPTLITSDVESTLEELIPLAPLHNPPALKGLAWARRWASSQWACSTRLQQPSGCGTPMRSRVNSGTRDSAASVFTASTTSTWRKPWLMAGVNKAGILDAAVDRVPGRPWLPSKRALHRYHNGLHPWKVW